MPWSLVTLALLVALGPPPGNRTRLVRPAERQAFYRSGGRQLIGKKIHLHVEATILRRQPRRFDSVRGGDLLVFENRSVPLVIWSRSGNWLQARRHLHDAREFCLRGVLRVPASDPRSRVHLYVTSVKRAPGTWK